MTWCNFPMNGNYHEPSVDWLINLIKQMENEWNDIKNLFPLGDLYYVNVLSPGLPLIGLDNTGVTDNTNRLQHIIDYFKNKKAVFIFPSGNYLFNRQINFYDDSYILGYNAQILMDSYNNVCWWLSGNNIYLDGFKFNTNANCIYVSVSENVRINNCYFTTRQNQPGYYEYAITISHSKFIEITNSFIDQPLPTGELTYNNADGIHINGGSENIVIENIYGAAGDDFIAINAAEPGTNPGSIKNVYIKNVHMTYNNKTSARGIRLYGIGENQKISNILIEDCEIYSSNDIFPLFITNNPGIQGSSSADKCYVNNLEIINCIFNNNNEAISAAYSQIDNININSPIVNNGYLFLITGSNIGTARIDNLVNCGILSCDENSNMTQLIVKDSVFNNVPYMFNVDGNLNIVWLDTGKIEYSALMTSTSTGHIDKFKMSNYIQNHITNNLIMYVTTSIMEFIGNNIEYDGYLISIPKTCSLLCANGNTFSSAKSNVVTVLNQTGLQRVKGFDIILGSEPSSGYAGDRYILNNSGTLELKIHDMAGWKTISTS